LLKRPSGTKDFLIRFAGDFAGVRLGQVGIAVELHPNLTH
jgi:hypothetical protein